MKRSSILCLIIGFLLHCYPPVLQAQTGLSKVTTTAVPFLRIAPDARSGALANAGIATGGGAWSIFHNMASTTFDTTTAAVAAAYTPWMGAENAGTYLGSLSGYRKLNENNALAGGIRYFNMGTVNLADEQGASLGTTSPREYGLDLGYAMKLGKQLSLGLSFRYIHSKLISGSYDGVNYKAGNAVAADISVYHDGTDSHGAGLTWGAVLSNLGTRIGYSSNATQKDFIPANLGIAAAYGVAPDEDNRIRFTLEINKLLVPAIPLDSAGIAGYYNNSVVSSWSKSLGSDGHGLRSLQYSAAAEYAFQKFLFLRAGYYFQSKSTGGQQYFTAGVGFKYSVADIDVAYLAPSGSGIDRNALSNTVRFSVCFAF